MSVPGHLVVSIPKASADGKYYSNYPNGDAPVGPISVRQTVWMSLATYAFQPYQVLLPGVLPGSLIYVQTAWPNDAGTTFPFSNWIVYDSNGGQGSPYTKIGERDDTAGADSESYAHYYLANSAGGDLTVSFYDTLAFEGGRLQYIGVTAHEIINANRSTPLVGHFETGPTGYSGTTLDSITGAITNTAAPALLIAGCGSNAGTAPSAAPNAGSGFTDLGAQWNFLGDSEKWIRSQCKRVTNTASQNLTFTPTGTDQYMMIAAAFKEG